MDEKQLLSKETFIDLFSKPPIDRISREDELFIIAKDLGIEKRFKESLKKYEKLFKEKIPLDYNLKLPQCKYEIDNYNMLNYTCNLNGITDESNYKFSYMPVLPVERYINKDTGKEKIKIIFYQECQWKELIVDRSQLAISQKILLLSDYGLDVNSENVKYYIRYFNDILNSNDIKKLDSVSHLGWKDDCFIPYNSHGIFDGADEFRNIYQAISSKGKYEKWKETIQELRKKKVIKILMALVLASPLLEKLSLQPYIVNLWSSLSGNGKTLSCMVAMSVWGNPEIGALRLSSNNTQNYYITIASFMRNITCYFDELQIIKNSKYFDMEGLVMDLCNGTEKGRLSKNSQIKEVKTWFNNFLFTSNNKIVDENAGEQLYNRVIDLEIGEKIIEDGQEVAKVIKENYGFAGKDYIKYVEELGFKEISRRYNEIFKEIIDTTPATTKQACSLASILLADQLITECVFKGEEALNIDDIKEFINNKDDIKTSIKAKNYIINVINANEKRFSENNYGENWGIISEYYCTINSEILFRELKKGGFEFNTVKKEWAEMGFLSRNSQGRYIHNTQVRSLKGTFVRLNIYQEPTE